MPTHQAAVRWNDQWWSEAVKGKKTALPKIENVRKTPRKESPVADVDTLDTNNVLPEDRYKTAVDVELQRTREALEKVLTAATVMKTAVGVEFEDAASPESAQANVLSLVEDFYRKVLRAVRSTY